MNRYPVSVAVLILTVCGCASSRSAQARNDNPRASPAVSDAALRFYQRMRTSNIAGFEEFISTDPSLLVMGSAGERFTDREKLRAVFTLKNQGLEAGQHPLGYECGDLGWFIDEPGWVFPDGSRAPMRFSGVLHREGDRWRFVHWHLSVAVPDDELPGLRERQQGKAH